MYFKRKGLSHRLICLANSHGAQTNLMANKRKQQSHFFMTKYSDMFCRNISTAVLFVAHNCLNVEFECMKVYEIAITQQQDRSVRLQFESVLSANDAQDRISEYIRVINVLCFSAS